MINFKALGKRIKDARKAEGLTQEKFAEMIDVATEYMSRIETGASRPSLALIEKISSAFGMEESELMFGEKSENVEDKVLMDKISALNPKKRRIAEHIIDEISEL